MSEERRERLAHGHKKRKHIEKCEFFERIARFYKQFARITSKSLTSLFFKERIAHGRSLK